MVPPLFLTLEQALALHADQVSRHGGDASLRDRGLLESALAMPMAQFGGAFLHHDLFEMAAAYMFHPVMNHPFVDGNKRTAFAAAVVFLLANGARLESSVDEAATAVENVASGAWSKDTITVWMRSVMRA